MDMSEMKNRLKAGGDPLELSIEKWQDIIAGTGRELGTSNCALCENFWTQGTCYGCPVRQKTGKDFCGDTPYQEYDRNYGFIERQTEAAKRELDFLISLRPIWAKMKEEKGGN